MGTTNFDGLALGTKLTNLNIASPNHVDTHPFFKGGTQTVATKIGGAIASQGGSIVDVRAYADTAPTGASLIVDLLINGVSAFVTTANRPTITAGQNASTTLLPDTVALNPGDRLRIDVLQVGSTVAGADLYVSVAVKRPNQ